MITLDIGSSLNRVRKRSLIEDYCLYAECFLPAHKKLLFLMYYRHGYSTLEISQLMMIHQSNICRRLRKIANELTEIIKEKRFEIVEVELGKARSNKKPCQCFYECSLQIK